MAYPPQHHHAPIHSIPKCRSLLGYTYENVTATHHPRTGALIDLCLFAICPVILRSPPMPAMLTSLFWNDFTPSSVQASNADGNSLPTFDIAAPTTAATKLWCSGHIDSGRRIRGKILDAVTARSRPAESDNPARATKSQPTRRRSAEVTGGADQVSPAEEIQFWTTEGDYQDIAISCRTPTRLA